MCFCAFFFVFSISFQVDSADPSSVHNFKEAFSLLDKKNEAHLKTEDIGRIMGQLLGNKPTEMELREMINQQDQDQEGIIDFSEFSDMMAKKKKNENDAKEELRKAFSVFSGGKDYIDANDLKRVMSIFGEKVTDQAIQEMLREATGSVILEAGADPIRISYAQFAKLIDLAALN